MKAKLIKRDNDYCLYNESGETIAASWANVTGKKLSKQNCDEIFGVVDVDDMMENILSNCEKTKDGYVLGFQMAMELNKDKVFTLEDMRNAIQFGLDGMFGYEAGEEGTTKNQMKRFIQSLQQLTEIDVEIVMETIYGIFDYKELRKKPKLDSEGYLILKNK